LSNHAQVKIKYYIKIKAEIQAEILFRLKWA